MTETNPPGAHDPFDPLDGPQGPQGPAPSSPGTHEVEFGPAPKKRNARRALLIGGLVGAVVLVGAGGSYAWTALASKGAQPAEVIPSTAFGYVRFDLDPSAGQKIAATRFLGKLPKLKADGQDIDVKQTLWTWIAGSQKKLQGLDYDTDVKSWLGDRATGFTDQEIVELQRITREFSIALKSKIERSVAQNIAHAYLGKRAGQAVLNGLIRRGDGEKITAALWYSDLRCSTELADRLSAEAFLQLLGHYFEMTAASVLDHGGEVVSLIGDAVLGLFRFDGAPDEACGRALAAASEARRRLNTSQSVANNVAFDFGVSLHLGQVIYGNVGVPERLQFTLVGSAVNETARIEDLTKTLERPVVASDVFARCVDRPWLSLGEHSLRGIKRPVEVFAPLAP